MSADAGGPDGPASPGDPEDGAPTPPATPATFFVGGAGAEAVDAFEGASSDGESPTVAYPADGTMVPPNLVGLEVHFTAAGHDLFEVSFSQAGSPSVTIYTTCTRLGAGCELTLDQDSWDALRARRDAGPYSLRVRGTGGDGDRIGVSTEVSLTLADEDVLGGVYYWTTQPPSIVRYDFDLGAGVTETFLSESDTGGRCVGCHALSRDGEQIAVGLGSPGTFGLYDVATRTSSYEAEGELMSFSPDGSELVTGGSFGLQSMTIRDTNDGRVVIDLGVSGQAPDWAPDGNRIVFAGPDGIGLLERSGAGWLRADDLRSGAGLIYPTFSPNSDWILFQDGHDPREDSRMSWGRISALRLGDGSVQTVVDAEGGSWPKWNPGVYTHDDRPLYWFTFSSRRAYGLEYAAGEVRSQIWMAAFDPGADGDPSHAAFRFPGQSSDAANLIPQWTLDVARQECSDDAACGASEVCLDGECVPDLI